MTSSFSGCGTGRRFLVKVSTKECLFCFRRPVGLGGRFDRPLLGNELADGTPRPCLHRFGRATIPIAVVRIITVRIVDFSLDVVHDNAQDAGPQALEPYLGPPQYVSPDSTYLIGQYHTVNLWRQDGSVGDRHDRSPIDDDDIELVTNVGK